MTKKYFVTKDQIDDSISATSENPVQNKVIKQALDAKLDIQQAVGDAGKVPTADATGKLVMTALPTAAQADWNQTTTTEQDFIKNKPFKAIGTGLTVKDVSGVQTLTADTQFKFQIFATLPTAAAEYAQTIALILKASTETGNVYDEYGCVYDDGLGTWEWEKLGAIKATVTQTAAAIEVDGVALQTADDTKIGLMSAADHADMQRVANKTTTIAAAASASDDKYPTEKAARTELDARVKFATGSTSTAFTVGVDANGYYLEE